MINRSVLTFGLAAFTGAAIALAGSFYFAPAKQTQARNTSPAVRLASTTASKPGTTVDLSYAAERATSSVVHIYAAQTKPMNSRQRQLERYWGIDGSQPFREGTGSGVILTENGYVVTNNHVIENADEIEVTMYNNKKYKAKLIGTDPSTDLAVLKIEAEGLPAIDKGNSDDVRIGQWVLAIGNPAVGYDNTGRPQQLNSTVTAGIVSARGRDIGVNDSQNAIESFIQTDAVVNPGNSGGALVNDQGQLIGINTAIATTNGRYQGYSFAIPINLMNKVIEDLIEFGVYKRVYLGVEISELDDERAKELDLSVSKGVVIEGIMSGGSAEKSGIKPMDVVVGVNGKAIENVPELQEAVSSSRVGETIRLQLIRSGKKIDVSVNLLAQKVVNN